MSQLSNHHIKKIFILGIRNYNQKKKKKKPGMQDRTNLSELILGTNYPLKRKYQICFQQKSNTPEQCQQHRKKPYKIHGKYGRPL